jgi:hypothetical protein
LVSSFRRIAVGGSTWKIDASHPTSRLYFPPGTGVTTYDEVFCAHPED